MKRKIKKYIREIFLSGGLIYLLSLIIIYGFSFFYIKNLDEVELFLKELGIDLRPIVPLFLLLIVLYIINSFAVYISVMSQKKSKLIYLFFGLLLTFFLDFTIFHYVISFHKHYVHIIPLMIADCFLVIASFRRTDFNNKFKYNLSLRRFTEIRRTHQIILHQLFSYKFNGTYKRQERIYELNVIWKSEKRVSDNSFLERVVDYDEHGSAIEYILKKKYYDLLEDCLILETNEKRELFFTGFEEVFDHLERMRESGWSLSDSDNKKLLLLSIAIDSNSYRDEKLKDKYEELFDQCFEKVLVAKT